MKAIKRAPSLLLPAALAALTALLGGCHAPNKGAKAAATATVAPLFEALQPKLFSQPGGETNAWADFDGDNDLDLFVGFRHGPNRLYRNDQGTFVDVAPQVGLADSADTRAVAWGDYNGDGAPDLYVGFSAAAHTPNRLYRNVDHGHHFVNVAPQLGLARSGDTAQPVWVDYDGDGDLDLFVAFRDQQDRLYRNDGGKFTDVTRAAGLASARKSAAAVWFDMDGDGDLDLFVTSADGGPNRVYVNQGNGTFVEDSSAMGMSSPGRTVGECGGVAVSDYNDDGRLDILETCAGGDVLWENMGGGHFRDVAPGTPLATLTHSVAAGWGDYDNDGWPDLYVATEDSADPQASGHLFRNVDGTFTDVTPEVLRTPRAVHGVAWADYDIDGDLDLALAGDDPKVGTDPMYVNGLPAVEDRRSLEIAVVDQEGRWTFPGAKVTVTAEPDAAHPVRFTSARLVDAGGGYASQGAQPVHFGLPAGVGKVDITVTWFEKGRRRTAKVAGVDPARFYAQWLTLHLGVR